MVATEQHMDLLAALEEIEAEATHQGGAGAWRGPRWSSRAVRATVTMVAGVALMAVAATILVRQSSGDNRPAGAMAPTSGAITLRGPADVTAQLATYEPGQDSGWHSHTGLHAVVVLSGTLTIYDEECAPHQYGPGDVYIGGGGAHLARNETAAPVEMTVTYLFPAGRSHTEFHVPASPPAGCAAR